VPIPGKHELDRKDFKITKMTMMNTRISTSLFKELLLAHLLLCHYSGDVTS